MLSHSADPDHQWQERNIGEVRKKERKEKKMQKALGLR